MSVELIKHHGNTSILYTNTGQIWPSCMCLWFIHHDLKVRIKCEVTISVNDYYCYPTAYYTVDFSNAHRKTMRRQNYTVIKANMQDGKALQTILHMNTQLGVEIKTASQTRRVLTHTKCTDRSAYICQHHSDCTEVGTGSFCLERRWEILVQQSNCFVLLCCLFPDHTSSICWSSALRKKRKACLYQGRK